MRPTQVWLQYLAGLFAMTAPGVYTPFPLRDFLSAEVRGAAPGGKRRRVLTLRPDAVTVFEGVDCRGSERPQGCKTPPNDLKT